MDNASGRGITAAIDVEPFAEKHVPKIIVYQLSLSPCFPGICSE
jgi:hypothetical protein